MDDTWRSELAEFIRIPSVSAEPAHREDVKRAGEWVCEFIRSKCGGTAQLTPFGAKELALGEIPASTDPDKAPTVLVYGHFDVQPPAPLDLWESDPFELLASVAGRSSQLGAALDAELASIELAAVAHATVPGYVHEALSACRDSGRTPAMIDWYDF